MGKLIVVTGAARSGKSGFAEKLAAGFHQEVVYFATAQAFDSEMERRIAAHQASRPAVWTTVEEPLAVAEKLAQYNDGADRVILLDCITLWLSNLLLEYLDEQGEPIADAEKQILGRVEGMLAEARRGSSTLICVTNEVGWSLVPENKLGRIYRDIAGRANQLLAKGADEVYLVVAGYPLELKALGTPILARIEGLKN